MDEFRRDFHRSFQDRLVKMAKAEFDQAFQFNPAAARLAVRKGFCDLSFLGPCQSSQSTVRSRTPYRICIQGFHCQVNGSKRIEFPRAVRGAVHISF